MRSDMFDCTLDDLMRHSEIDIEDKKRAFVCYKRISMAYPLGLDPSHEPLMGDKVTIVNLTNHDDLNGCNGRLGSYDTGRWQVLGPNVRVKPENLICEKWLMDRRHNTSVQVRGRTYILRIDVDKTVRCITPEGAAGSMIRMKTPLEEVWSEGWNAKEPWNSHFEAHTMLDALNPLSEADSVIG